MAASATALVAFMILVAVGVASTVVGRVSLIFIQYAAQMFGGYVAGRLAASARVLHGGLAGMAMAALGIAIGTGFAGSDISIGLIIIALTIAAVSGSAGGALAEYRHRQAEGR